MRSTICASDSNPRRSIHLGDRANDRAMLGAAGLGIAYRAKPSVKAMSHAGIDRADLTALLYAQGYAVADLIVP